MINQLRSQFVKSLTRAPLIVPLEQEVASLLLARGSLRFGQLAALSALPQQYIYSSLLILSIHGLLYHSESEINGRLVELYEMNETAVEQRIHGGLYVDMAREWDPTSGLDVIVESLWQHGMQRKDSLIEQAAGALLERDSAPPPPLEPGKLPERLTSKSMEPKYADFAAGESCQDELSESTLLTSSRPSAAKKAAAKTLRRAFAEGYVCIVIPGSQLSPSSLEIKWEEELRRAIQGKCQEFGIVCKLCVELTDFFVVRLLSSRQPRHSIYQGSR